MLESGLVAYLLANPPIDGLIGNRLYPGILPENPTLPALVYQVISAGIDYSHDGDSHLDMVRVQFSAWGNTPLQAAQVREALRLALSGFSGQMGQESVPAVFLEDRGSDVDEETGLHRQIIDAICWHQSR